jgi:poly(hydroxyalkanoate) depolymerase family esterase
VKELPVSLANNVDFLRRLPRLDRVNGLAELGRLRPDIESPLVEVRDFGPNPGALRMFAFVPETMQPTRALVVVLHGCGQTAAGYDHGAGWSTLAKHYGFALLIPEQQLMNNANGCYNWFNPEDVTRNGGEVASIRQMIARMVEEHGIDPHRIFVNGLSAGGAMTSAMLATYPEVFSAGAVIAGLAYGVANNVRDALTIMRATPVRTPRRLGDFVRDASPHKGPWPRLSVWHGSVDGVVAPANAREIIKQWLDVHHLPQAPMSEGVVDGYPRRVWWNADGETIVESYTITAMAHGTPLGVAENEQRYGVPGAFMLEAGISSSYHIAKFFGLTERVAEAKAELKKPELKAPEPKAAMPARKQAAKTVKVNDLPTLVIPSMPMPDFTEVFDPGVMMQARAEREGARAEREGVRAEREGSRAEQEQVRPEREKPRRRGIDVGRLITRALTAAGLMK